MKCQSCEYLVSSEFTHAYTTNDCPKCGKDLMKKEVQKVWRELNKVLAEAGSDIGDVAAYIYKTYIAEKDESNPQPAVKDDEVMFVKRNEQKSQKSEHYDEAKARREMFAKRAGVTMNKEKLEDIKNKKAKDIQSYISGSDIADLSDDEDYEDLGLGGGMDYMQSMLEVPNQPSLTSNIEELKKLGSLENFESGSGGFRRSS